MGLSIITPHFNDLEGLQRIYACLLEQTNHDWEWIIVDDCSEKPVIDRIENWHQSLKDERVKFNCNVIKSNASVCRNLGAKIASNELLLFLDSDDYISSDFVENRQIEVTDFTVYKNFAFDDKYQGVYLLPKVDGDYLNRFLKTDFIWQTSAILWSREFFNKIGQFETKLSRLQDVELSIRALQQSNDYSVLDNSIDFYYRVKPISERKNFVKIVGEAVYLFISELLDVSSFNKYQLSLISSYYYLCVKYLARFKSKDDIDLLLKNLKLFHRKGFIHFGEYITGFLLLKLYKWNLISSNMFLRVNRYIFKSKNIEDSS